MYDNVRLFAPRTKDTLDISKYLDVANEQTNLKTGEISRFGSLKGLRICEYPSGVSIIGSLAKYRFGNNVCSLDARTTAQTIENISDALHLNLSDALVTGIEFGTNIVMSKPVGVYLRKLGEYPRMIRSNIMDDTLYFKPRGKQQPKVICAYDKIKQVKRDKMPIPVGLEDAHLFRFEIRYKGRLPKQLGVSEVTASTLFDKVFYAKLVKLWQNSYFAISKKSILKFDDMSNIKSVSDAFDVFVARLISKGDQNSVAEFLAELRDANVFENRNYYTRLKQKIEGVMSKTSKVADDDMQELDDGIKNVGAYI